MIRWRAARSLLVLAAIACGCGEPSGPSRDTEGETTGTAEPAPPPDFGEPASGRLDVPLSRVEDVALDVVGILPGNTRLLVDGLAHGSLDDGDPAGTLSGESLVLRMRGAMVPGMHEMQLVNAGGGEELLVSSVVEVHLLPVDAAPTLVAETTGSAHPGDAIATAGHGEHGVLSILDAALPDAPVLVVAPSSADGWDFAAARRVAISGYRQADGETGLAIAVQRVGPIGDAQADRLRVAWRVGAPGVAIDLIDAAWSQVDETTVGTRAFDLDPQVLGPYEHAELRTPALLGDTLVAEVLAATDVEAPRPGDRTLVHARLLGTPAAAVDPARLVLDARMDIDAIGPVLDPARAEVGGPASIGARLDGRTPVVLEADPEHGRLSVRPSAQDGRARALSGVTGPLATVVGAFGSRSVAGRLPGDPGRVRLAEIDDWGANGVVEHSLAPDTLPDPNGATGDLVATTIAGHAVWLLPYGPDVPVHAVITGAEEVVVQPIENLRCDRIAVAFDPREPGAPRHTACATGGGEIVTSRLRGDPGA